jgi:hypothetical protein
MKYFILLILFISTVLRANDQIACGENSSFLAYKAGVYAEKNGFIEDSFDIYCQLAFQGDYRAQFKLAQFYKQGIPNILNEDVSFAYVWAKLSNSYIQSTKRSSYIQKIKLALNHNELINAEKLYDLAKSTINTGRRIDQEYKKLDLDKYLNKNRSKSYTTGSRIKDNEPILNVRKIK